MMKWRRVAGATLLGYLVATGCMPTVPTAPTGDRPPKSPDKKPSPSPSASASAPAVIQSPSPSASAATPAPSASASTPPVSAPTPVLTQVSPAVAGPGVEVTLTGDHFRAEQTLQVTFGSVTATSPTRVDDKTLKVTVPVSAANGEVKVTVGGLTSNGKPFQVIETLAIGANPIAVLKGTAYTFRVTATDSAGEALVDPPVVWSATGDGLTVDATGKVQGATLGTGTVTAKSGTVSATLDVTVVSSIYRVSTFAGGPGSAIGTPEFIAFGQDDCLYVSDSAKHVIHKVTPQGAITTFAGSTAGYAEGQGAAAKFDSPRGLGFDGQGNLYVADQNNHRIRKITPGGLVSTILGNGTAGSTPLEGALGEAPGTCASPLALKVDGTNNVYFTEVADGVTRRARRLTPGRELSVHAALTFPGGSPTYNAAPWPDLVMNGSTMIVPESNTNRQFGVLYRVLDGEASAIAGGSTSGTQVDGVGEDADFGALQGIGLDNDGNYYVSDLSKDGERHVIRRITPEGAVTTIAGSTKGFADHDGSAAAFLSPTDVTLGPDGALYVADRGNGRIRKLTLIQAD